MPIPIFDTLKYANALKAADVPEKQAEAQAMLMGEALSVNLKELVTKDDLLQVEQRLNAKIDVQSAKFSGDINQLRWMMGISLSLTLAVLALLIRLLFVKL